jgi:hypothetical protein
MAANNIGGVRDAGVNSRYFLAPLIRSMRSLRRSRFRRERRFSGEVTHAKMMKPAAASSPKITIPRIEAKSIGASSGPSRSGTGLLDKWEESGPRVRGTRREGLGAQGPSANRATLPAREAIRHLGRIRARAA